MSCGNEVCFCSGDCRDNSPRLPTGYCPACKATKKNCKCLKKALEDWFKSIGWTDEE